MRAIDFTHPGGFPLTQDELDYLQQAYTECINALGSLGGHPTTPAIISGVVKTISGGTTTVTSGWMFHNGTMIRFNGGSVTPTGSDIVTVRIDTTTTNLTYNDGLIHPSLSNVTASLIAAPYSFTPTQFPFSILQPYQYFFGLGGREAAWNSIPVNTSVANGGVGGTIYYKKNWLTNTLTIQASLTANNAQNFTASPGALNYLMGTLPAGYAPVTTAYFTTYYYASSLFKDDLGVSWIKHLNSVVNTAGQVLINFIRPDVAVPAFTVMFNTIIPLD